MIRNDIKSFEKMIKLWKGKGKEEVITGEEEGGEEKSRWWIINWPAMKKLMIVQEKAMLKWRELCMISKSEGVRNVTILCGHCLGTR